MIEIEFLFESNRIIILIIIYRRFVNCRILIRAKTAPTNLTMRTLVIPWKKRASKDHAEIIKWSHGNTKYEIYIPILEDLAS